MHYREGIAASARPGPAEVLGALDKPVEQLQRERSRGPLLRFRCSTCGYGASCRAAPARCPMCGGSAWELEAWRPFGRLDEDLQADLPLLADRDS